MKPIYAEVYEQGVEKGYEVANVKTYYDENGQAKVATVVNTPYYDANGNRVIGSGTVNATHGKGLREVDNVDLLFDDFGQMSLFDENGNAVDKETMKTEMSQYMSAASEYPHVASYDEWYDNQKHNYEKVKLDAEPTKSDYVKYLDNVSQQMSSGDIKFVGPISTQQDFVKYLDNMSMAGADIKASNPQIKNSYADRIQMVTSNLQSASGIAGWNNHTNSKDRKVNGVDIAQVKIYGDTFDDGMLVSKDNQQIKNSYDDVYEQGVAKGYEISSVRTASIDAGQRDVLGYGESAVISMKTPYFDSKGSAVTGLASVPLVKDAERQSNTVEFLVNGYNMDYILGGDRKLYTNTGAQVNVEQARQEMGQFAAAGSKYLAKVRDNGGIDALKSDDVVYDPVMSMKKDFLKNILDNMRKEGTFPKDKTQEKSEHVKMITPKEAKKQ